VMTIATSDSGSGAGINADLKTIAANHCYGTSVFVALTAQNTQAVNAIYPIEADFICSQFHTILDDIGTDTIKIGMLHRQVVIETVAKLLSGYPQIPVVLDPVMISQSGYQLLETDAMQAMTQLLFPLASLITPNLQEAAWLLNQSEINADQMLTSAKRLAELYQVNVLLKGGHLAGDECQDLLYEYQSGNIHYFKHQRIDTFNCHGTGCTLSAAIASQLALGQSLTRAISIAVDYLQRALIAGKNERIGHGPGPVKHFH